MISQRPIKICILADSSSIHTVRWATALKKKGFDVCVVSYVDANIPDIHTFHLLTPKIQGISPTSPLWSRFHYLFGTRQAKKIIHDINPDILHAFWATSYGFLGARMNHPNFYISVWGREITHSARHILIRPFVIYALKKAKKIFATSRFLLEETKKYVKDRTKLIQIPFGIEKDKFYPIVSENNKEEIIIGSTKAFEPWYGILELVEAFKLLVDDGMGDVRLMLIGKGSQEPLLRSKITEYGLNSIVEIIPPQPHENLVEFLNQMDIYVIPSLTQSETFGVAAAEASACALPVVGSRIGGIPEVIIDGKTGILTNPGDVIELKSALQKLIQEPDTRKRMGEEGCKYILEVYDWDKNVHSLIDSYD
ncbi:MAG: glycosyltransferase [Candidatus Marinimicrobia bacterium]|nr:glycosyltransferase [Candidatus Neomarinimicrobiota bacterium]